MIFQCVKEVDMDANRALTLIEECKELIRLKGSKGSSGRGHKGRFARDDPDYFDFIFNALENVRR